MIQLGLCPGYESDKTPSRNSTMVAPRALVVFLIVDAQFPEKPFHIPHVLAMFIAGLIHAFF